MLQLIVDNKNEMVKCLDWGLEGFFHLIYFLIFSIWEHGNMFILNSTAVWIHGQTLRMAVSMLLLFHQIVRDEFSIQYLPVLFLLPKTWPNKLMKSHVDEMTSWQIGNVIKQQVEINCGMPK
jgi:hypothetical protein